MIHAPAHVAETLLACFGEEGQHWLDDLPQILEGLTKRWGLRLGPPFSGGCVAYVAPAERADGSHVVLKVSFIDDETRYEGDALALWAGNGAALLLDRDPDAGALLLERIEPGAALLDHPDRQEAIRIACHLLRRLWIPAGPVHPFRLATNLAEDWADHLVPQYHAAGCSFDAKLLEKAVELSAKLSLIPNELVLVNRDFHLGNVLSATREPWLVIDPKPLAGEPAFDTGHFLRSSLSFDFTRAEVENLLRLLSDELALPPQRMAAWAYVRSVENAIWASETKLEDAARDVRCAEILTEWL